MALSYFFFFVTFGILVPYLSPTLLELGFSRREIGHIHAAMYGCNMIFAVWGGRLSDKYLSADRTIRLCALTLCGLAGLMWLGSTLGPIYLLLPLVGFAAARAPLIPLQDTLAMQVADRDPRRYSNQRVWGSLSFALAAIGFGYLAASFSMAIFFPALLVACLLFVLAGMSLPKEEKKPKPPGFSGFWSSLNRSWWLWLTAMTLYSVCFGPYNYGFTLLLQEAQVPGYLTGWIWTVGVAVEIIVFLMAGTLFDKFGFRKLMLVAFAANMLRWVLLALSADPWLITVSQLLHGPGFALFYAAAMQAIHHYSRGVRQASYQGLFSTVVGGLGNIIGVDLAGGLHEIMPMQQTVRWFLPIQALALIILCFNRLEPNPERKEQVPHDV